MNWWTCNPDEVKGPDTQGIRNVYDRIKPRPISTTLPLGQETSCEGRHIHRPSHSRAVCPLEMGGRGEGFASVGAWAAGALDASWSTGPGAGRPIPLAWSIGAFKIRLLDGYEVTLCGHLSPPFGYFRGTAEGPVARHHFSLVHLPVCKLIASLRSARQAQTLASELAPILAWDEHGGAAVVERHVREQA